MGFGYERDESALQAARWWCGEFFLSVIQFFLIERADFISLLSSGATTNASWCAYKLVWDSRLIYYLCLCSLPQTKRHESYGMSNTTTFYHNILFIPGPGQSNGRGPWRGCIPPTKLHHCCNRGRSESTRGLNVHKDGNHGRIVLQSD